MDRLEPMEGMGSVGEVRITPDPATFAVLPYNPKRASMMADLTRLDGRPWEACARSFLKRMVAQAADRGLAIQAAFEPEWTLAEQRDGEFVPFDTSLCFSSLGMTTAQDVIDDIVSAFTDQGIQVEHYYPELGHGQQEISIRHAEAVSAADRQVMYRETVRNVAWRHGLYTSFAPKPFKNQAGNGAHLHFSAWNPGDTRNLFYDETDRLSLSRLAYNFIGGVLKHLPALVCITCPSVNSYRRLVPGTWSSAFTCYGPDNREAAVRVASPYKGQEMQTVNLELKASDNSSNPYLSLGATIAAGLDGVANDLMPEEGQFVDIDPVSLSEEERDQRGIRRLPSTLEEAIKELEGDQMLIDALGPELSASFLTVRRSDQELFAAEDDEFELKHHFYKF